MTWPGGCGAPRWDPGRVGTSAAQGSVGTTKLVVTLRANVLEPPSKLGDWRAFPTALAGLVWLGNVYVAASDPDPRPRVPEGCERHDEVSKGRLASPLALFAFQSDGHQWPLCRLRQVGGHVRARRARSDVQTHLQNKECALKATHVRGKRCGMALREASKRHHVVHLNPEFFGSPPPNSHTSEPGGSSHLQTAEAENPMTSPTPTPPFSLSHQSRTDGEIS